MALFLCLPFKSVASVDPETYFPVTWKLKIISFVYVPFQDRSNLIDFFLQDYVKLIFPFIIKIDIANLFVKVLPFSDYLSGF